MPNLSDLLKSIDIDVDGVNNKNNENNEDEIKLEDISLDDIPKEQQPIFKKLIDTVDLQKNEIAKNQLINSQLKDIVKSGLPKENEKETGSNDKEEKILGVLDKDDPYAPAFQTLTDMIGNVNSKIKVEDSEKVFEDDIKNIAMKNKDIVRYVKEMDELHEQYPNMQAAHLYSLAKSLKEGRDKKSQDTNTEVNRQNNLNRFTTESQGTFGGNVKPTQKVASIGEAFELAEKDQKIGNG